jgi:hypothetical protein
MGVGIRPLAFWPFVCMVISNKLKMKGRIKMKNGIKLVGVFLIALGLANCNYKKAETPAEAPAAPAAEAPVAPAAEAPAAEVAPAAEAPAAEAPAAPAAH